MKTRILKNLVAGVVGLAAVGLAGISQAQVFVLPSSIAAGSTISFIGGATLNGSLSTATAFDSIFGTSVLPGSQTGDYTSVPDSTPATFTAFQFNPSPSSSFTLWNFTVGPTVYSFLVDPGSVSVTHQDSTFLNITGTGMAHIDGFTDTAGVWSLTDTGLGGTPVFTFGASTTVVPEPSSTALMLGFGALLLSFAFRKRAKV